MHSRDNVFEPTTAASRHEASADKANPSHPEPFTCIAWASGPYKALFSGLRSDCERFGYPCHLYEIDANYTSLVKAWCNHPHIIRQGVKDFGRVLYLDVECRIVASIPPSWRAPLVSVRWPEQKFWIRYNTGTVMADESCLPWLDAWIRIIDDWDLGSLGPDDHVHWPGDLCDELALSAALGAFGVRVQTPRLAYTERDTGAEIARGLWRNKHTIIQHPTQHHWPKENDPVECKKLFVQNYPGDPSEAHALLTSGTHGETRRHGWAFDAQTQTYGPEEFWPHHARDWHHGPVQLTSAQR